MKKQAIIFDLDYTLLDTKRFFNGLARALGLSRKKFKQDYERFFSVKKINYSLEKHLPLILADKKSAQAVEVRNRLKNFWLEVNQYLYPEAENLLRDLKAKGYRLYLLTYGEPKWQQQKVERLKKNILMKLFSPIKPR